jgi:hypothetical protein
MPSGDRAEARICAPTQLGTSTTTLVTVPAGQTYICKQILICNTDTVDRTVTLAIGSAATASNRIISALPIGANDIIVLDTALLLLATETLQGLSDVASKVNVTIVGIDKTN